MEIEVGEYVRTRETGHIGKIVGIIENFVEIKAENMNYIGIYTSSILKHSKDITDLIEKDDYVNNYKVIEVTNHTFTTLEHGGNKVHHKECVTIKSILTKEQFKNNLYILGG